MKFSLRGSQPDRDFVPVRLFFFVLLMVLTPSSFGAPANTSTLDGWIRLLHYRQSALGGWVNDAGPEFFVHPGGATDPEAEFQASIEELRRSDSQFHCRFPARALYLVRNRRDLRAPQKPCPEFEGFRSRIAATGASVVFSSYYLNNPSSAFGHSFLRIHRTGSSELLDTGIGYAARMTTNNAFLYAIYGIFGLFSGEYTALPYYYKVREYADAENRDLWSYDLNLSPSEIELLVAHLWELPRAERRYYYFSKNCAYELLAILEAILDSSRGKPQILDRVPWFVIPSHSLQALVQEPGLVRAVHYRPSLRKSLESRLSNLSSEDRQKARDWNEVPSTPALGARVLDARIDWLDFEFFEKLVRDDPAASALKQSALIARAQTGVIESPPQPSASQESEPTRGHPPRRIQAFVARTQGGRAHPVVALRPALQDLLDPGTGYPDSARLEFTQAIVSWDRQLRLDELSLFRAQSLTPIGPVRLDPSWKVGLLMDRNSGARNSSDLAGRIEVSGGLTVPLLPSKSAAVRAFALTGARTHLGSIAGGTWIRPAGTLELGLHARWKDHFALLATWERIRFLNFSVTADDRWRSVLGISARFHWNREWGAQASFEAYSGVGTWQSGLSYFF